MKKVIILLIVAIMCAGCSTIKSLTFFKRYNASVERVSKPGLSVKSVLKTSMYTEVEFVYKNPEGAQSIFLHPTGTPSAYFISDGQRIYKQTSIEKGVPSVVETGQTIGYTIRFQPLPESVMKFDIIEGERENTRNWERGWHFYGVTLQE